MSTDEYKVMLELASKQSLNQTLILHGHLGIAVNIQNRFYMQGAEYFPNKLSSCYMASFSLLVVDILQDEGLLCSLFKGAKDICG